MNTNIYPTMPYFDSFSWFEKLCLNNARLYLSHLADQPNLKFLQIGVYAGDASKWFLEFILTDKTSHLYDLDTWEGSEDIQGVISMEQIEKAYDVAISAYSNITKIKASSFDYLPKCPIKDFDFIYVDGAHDVIGVIKDAENSWRLLKVGGIMAFDDYDRGKTPETSDLYVYQAVNTFLQTKTNKYQIIENNSQLWLVKTAD